MVKVLVVDDERCMRFVFREILSSAGYDVSVAEDADEALAHVERHEVDVVVSDFLLPRMTGIELAERLRDIAPGVRVILMTGDLVPEVELAARRAGVSTCLAKPMAGAVLLKAVADESPSAESAV